MIFYKKLFHYFEACRDQFISKQVLDNSDITISYPFRLLASMSLISIFLILLFIILYPLVSRFSWPGSALSSAIGMILLIAHSVLLHQLKHRKSHIFSAQILVSTTLIAVIAGIYITGGPLQSLISIFLPTPIIMAFLLISRESGLKYAVFTFSVYILLTSINIAGFDYPQTIAIASLQPVKIMLWLFFTCTILALVIAYDDLTTKLIRQLKLEQEKQTYLATHDILTGLPNNRRFEEKINEAIHRSRRMGNQVTLLTIDLDKLKLINDSFGHAAGDAILIHVARQIDNTIRTDDLAARTGSDEFGIILQSDNTKKALEPLIRRLNQNIAHAIHYDGKDLTISSSVGAAIFPDHANDKEELIKAADAAMYIAKSRLSGWAIFSEDKSQGLT